MSGTPSATKSTPPPSHAGVTTTSATKTGVDKAQSWLTVASTTFGIIGAVGTGAVWLIANFYTGTVEVKANQPVESVIIKVYDTRGKETTFHSKTLQLMPGTYHLEVVLPDGRSRHFDTAVKFGETSALAVSVSDKASETEAEPVKKKRWFQFWRSENDQEQKPGG